jgi:hypothetical protein
VESTDRAMNSRGEGEIRGGRYGYRRLIEEVDVERGEGGSGNSPEDD